MAWEGKDRRAGERSVEVAVLETRLDGHEAVCAQRYGEIRDALTAVGKAIERTNSRMMAFVISALVTAIGVLATFTWFFFFAKAYVKSSQ